MFALLVCTSCPARPRIATRPDSTAPPDSPAPAVPAQPPKAPTVLAVWPPDWGTAPSDPYDMAEAWPPLPQAAGWASFQSQGRREPFVAGAGLVLLGHTTSETLTALDLATGRQLWEVAVPNFKHWLGGHSFITAQAVVLPGGDGVIALDSTTGKTLWTTAGYHLLTAGTAGAWVSRLTGPAQAVASAESAPGEGLLLLDAASGSIVQSFDTGNLLGYAEQIPADGTTMAVATKDELLLAHSDGTLGRLRRVRPGWPAVLCLDDAGVLECAFGPRPVAGLNRWTARLMEREAKLKPGQRTGIPEAPAGATHGVVEARLYSLPALTPEWKTAWVDWRLQGNALESLRLNSQSVVIAGTGTRDIQVIERVTGHRRQVAAFTRLSNTRAYPLAGQLFVYSGPEAEFTPEQVPFKTGWLDPLTGAALAGEPGIIDWPGPCFADGRLCYLSSTPEMTLSGRLIPQSTAVVCLQLDAALQPVNGELQHAAAPEPHTKLVKAFYSNDDPLAQAELMRSAVSAGQRGLGQLCLKADSATPAQLDALVRLTAYLEEQLASQPGTAEASEGGPARALPRMPLLAAFRQRGPALGAELQRWTQDPQLKVLHDELTAALLESGAPEALAYVRQAYPPLKPAPLAWPQPPFKIDKTNPVSPDEAQPPRLWSQATAKGKTYAAFTANWLGASQEIFLGLDAKPDGTFGRIVPTGLRQAAAPEPTADSTPSEADSTAPSAPPAAAPEPAAPAAPGAAPLAAKAPPEFELRIKGELATFRHRWQRISYDSRSGYPEPGRAQLRSQQFNLTQLLLDTDGDGLTDILERELFNDTEGSDSDDDGIKDLIDPTPHVDEAKLGALERGVARALLNYFSYLSTAAPTSETPPLRAIYIDVAGCKPVAVALPQRYCINVATDAQRKALAERGVEEPVYVQVKAPPAQNAAAAGERTWTVSIIQGYTGWAIELKKVGGELYPIRQYELMVD